MTLLIRDLPDDVARQLEASAKAARRSKEKQAMFLIETGLRRKRNPAELREEAKKIHSQFKGAPVSMADVLKWTEAEH
jgi:plasmid stability protein